MKLRVNIIYSLTLIILTGLIFLILGIALPEKINYEKFKKRIDKGGYVNIYDLNARIAVLEEKNKILESKIKNLEDEIRKLK